MGANPVYRGPQNTGSSFPKEPKKNVVIIGLGFGFWGNHFPLHKAVFSGRGIVP